MIQENRRSRAHIDLPLLVLVFGLAIFGVLAVTVATFPAGGDANASLLNHIIASSYAVRQCVYLGIAAPLVLIVLLNIPYDTIRRLTGVLFWGTNLLLLVVWVFNRAEGVKAWLDIIWGMTIQPS